MISSILFYFSVKALYLNRLVCYIETHNRVSQSVRYSQVKPAPTGKRRQMYPQEQLESDYETAYRIAFRKVIDRILDQNTEYEKEFDALVHKESKSRDAFYNEPARFYE